MAFVELIWLGPSGQQAECFPALRNDGCETSVNAAALHATSPGRDEKGYDTAVPERASFHDASAASSFLYLISACG